ncbi:hypothetical protein P154DRAFT_559103 [Amniculicola lignicola CBS 123094]|uniref:Uncharacterized protein n=1 Tax=Amniculicola lignicola CBS 123094 TaxID=1392246 RepID=A0A6A5X198_9PLEO|nr:hypothetical protein P154DRAFT_559103 [Amniculicola lignicola CBS 123094]
MPSGSVSGGQASDIPDSSSNSPNLDPSTFHEWEGCSVQFSDGSFWKLTKPLSKTAYQQVNPPFEGRRVFTCVCVKDPNHKYTNINEAAVKVKYQVKSTSDIIHTLKESVAMWTERARQCPESKEIASNLELAQVELQAATEPVSIPNKATFVEYFALRRFTSMDCQYAPRLLCHTAVSVTPGTSRIEMVGGYAILMLMTKLPGEPLNYRGFWSMPLEEREAVRITFKEALLEIWWQGISPWDCAMRNIVWDSEGRKCYIVDFEDYSQVHYETEEDLQQSFSDDILYNWGISEKSFAGWQQIRNTAWFHQHDILIMVFELLTLATVPTAIGAVEAVHQQRVLNEEAESDERKAPFYIDVFCDAKSSKRDEVDGSMVVLKDGKLRLWPKDPKTHLPKADPNDSSAPHPFKGFFLPFPAADLPHRPIPAPRILGLVSEIPPDPSISPSSRPSKPRLNWICIDVETRELKYGPRAVAKENGIGPWDWTEDEVGLTLDGEESLVAVEEEKVEGGLGWAVYYDRDDDCLKGEEIGRRKRVLRCSLERRMVNREDEKIVVE